MWYHTLTNRRLRQLLLLSLPLLVALGSSPARAMEFALAAGDGGRRIVVARGLIQAGDAERLRAALQMADRDAFGLRTIAFDSPGGAVDEAFAMTGVMDREKVAAVVRKGASCASACAQIVFLAATHRTVDDGGRLGLHSCSRAGDGTRAQLCNEIIAQQASARGAPYGTIMAFMQLTPPGQIRWLDAEDSDCWGLTLWPPGSGRGIQAGDAPPCILHGPRPRNPSGSRSASAR
ncbi:MAG: hypothetical protein K2X72_14935 [Reyranella sp.]|nr:hypothetical protein [Reyranella sp.]